MCLYKGSSRSKLVDKGNKRELVGKDSERVGRGMNGMVGRWLVGVCVHKWVGRVTRWVSWVVRWT